jgi:hypothetical protein
MNKPGPIVPARDYSVMICLVRLRLKPELADVTLLNGPLTVNDLFGERLVTPLPVGVHQVDLSVAVAVGPKLISGPDMWSNSLGP